MSLNLFSPWSSLQELDALKGPLQTWVTHLMKPQHLLVNRNQVDRKLENRFYLSYTSERGKVVCIIATVSKTNKQTETLEPRVLVLVPWASCSWRIAVDSVVYDGHSELHRGKTRDDCSCWNFSAFPPWSEVGLEARWRVLDVTPANPPSLPGHLTSGWNQLSGKVLVSGSVTFLKGKGL